MFDLGTEKSAVFVLAAMHNLKPKKNCTLLVICHTSAAVSNIKTQFEQLVECDDDLSGNDFQIIFATAEQIAPLCCTGVIDLVKMNLILFQCDEIIKNIGKLTNSNFPNIQ